MSPRPSSSSTGPSSRARIVAAQARSVTRRCELPSVCWRKGFIPRIASATRLVSPKIASPGIFETVSSNHPTAGSPSPARGRRRARARARQSGSRAHRSRQLHDVRCRVDGSRNQPWSIPPARCRSPISAHCATSSALGGGKASSQNASRKMIRSPATAPAPEFPFGQRERRPRRVRLQVDLSLDAVPTRLQRRDRAVEQLGQRRTGVLRRPLAVNHDHAVSLRHLAARPPPSAACRPTISKCHPVLTAQPLRRVSSTSVPRVATCTQAAPA